MRTAQTSVRPKNIKYGNRIPQLRANTIPGRESAATRAGGLFALLFLIGYVPGIFAGHFDRTGSEIGNFLAGYYTDFSRITSWSSLFTSQIAATFLQIMFMLLCGFSALGVGFLAIFFLSRGVFLGFCAANVLTQGGVTALGQYWITTCLFNILLLFVLLWLAGYAVQLSHGLFQSVFLGGAPRGKLHTSAKRLALRCGMGMMLSVLFSFLCSFLAVFFIRVFS